MCLPEFHEWRRLLAAGELLGARFAGLEAEHGTLEAGKRADLILLDGNPLDDIDNTRRISAVILGGRVHDRAALDEMLEEVVAAIAAYESGGGD